MTIEARAMFAIRPDDDYQTCRERFAWELPERFNIAEACCDRHARAQPEAPAVITLDDDGRRRILGFTELAGTSTRLAAALARRGIKAGDRIAILLPQGRAVAIAHMAAYKLGAIALPLAHVFRADALGYRLKDAEVAALITDAEGLAKVAPLRRDGDCPALRLIVSTAGGPGPDDETLAFDALTEEDAAGFAPADTHRDDPCLMIYTSGTTGQPKGTLHGMRVLLGHLPGFLFHHQPFERTDALFWTPADWAWAGGLLNLLLPALFHGKPVLAWPFAKFDPDAALALMAREKVTHAFLPPTALRMLRSARAISVSLDSLACAGEALGEGAFRWARQAFGIAADEFYGQTECNYVLGSSARRGVSKPGATGKPLPGARVAVIGGEGVESQPGEEGEIAVGCEHPSTFLRYWNAPEATAAKFRGEWMLTGDRAVRDADGFIAFIGRNDDIITSAGYRIGPSEVEDCLQKHEAVALAAVIGKPDPLRTEIVKAFIVLREGFAASDALVAELQDFVRTRLSVYEYPREIAFVAELPMTSTGKIMRRLLRE